MTTKSIRTSIISTAHPSMADWYLLKADSLVPFALEELPPPVSRSMNLI